MSERKDHGEKIGRAKQTLQKNTIFNLVGLGIAAYFFFNSEKFVFPEIPDWVTPVIFLVIIAILVILLGSNIRDWNEYRQIRKDLD